MLNEENSNLDENSSTTNEEIVEEAKVVETTEPINKVEENKEEKKEEPKEVKDEKKKHSLNIIPTILSIIAIVISVVAITSDYEPEKVVIYETKEVPSLPASEISTTEMIQEVSKSVVEIQTEASYMTWFGEASRGGAGSGVIMSEDGYIVTNYHVIEGANSISVRLSNGDQFDAKLVGGVQARDIAVIKIEATNLTPVKFADSNDILAGESVYAIGNPLGTLGGSVTDGIISATSRYITVENGNELSVIQHSAPISPGNSGGALFNSRGELIGITTAKSGENLAENIGFALPSNDVLSIATDLIEYGYVKTPVIGITVQAILTEDARLFNNVDELGIYISSIALNSDAKQKGLEVGDLIVEIDGNTVKSTNDITRTLRRKEVGETVDLTVKRNGEKLTYTIELVEQAR